MTAEEAIKYVQWPQPVGPVTFADVLFAFEAWICARVARAMSVQAFEAGGRVPRRVFD